MVGVPVDHERRAGVLNHYDEGWIARPRLEERAAAVSSLSPYETLDELFLSVIGEGGGGWHCPYAKSKLFPSPNSASNAAVAPCRGLCGTSVVASPRAAACIPV